MGTQINVNQQDATNAVASFDQISQDYLDISQAVTDIQSALYGEWMGQTARACKSTFTKIEECLGDLGDAVEVHAKTVKSGLSTFIAADQAAASVNNNVGTRP